MINRFFRADIIIWPNSKLDYWLYVLERRSLVDSSKAKHNISFVLNWTLKICFSRFELSIEILV